MIREKIYQKSKTLRKEKFNFFFFLMYFPCDMPLTLKVSGKVSEFLKLWCSFPFLRASETFFGNYWNVLGGGSLRKTSKHRQKKEIQTQSFQKASKHRPYLLLVL